MATYPQFKFGGTGGREREGKEKRGDGRRKEVRRGEGIGGTYHELTGYVMLL